MLESVGIIVLFVALALAALLAVASRRPDTFRIERSASIDAAPETIFALIADLRAMNGWNPFVLGDPAIKGTYSGPAAGNGSAYEFQGRKSGSGRIEIVDAVAPSKVDMRLAMVKPMKADNRISFMLQPKDGTTTVTWSMSGDVRLPGKVLHAVFNMEKMMGGRFEAGLASLKAMAEKP